MTMEQQEEMIEKHIAYVYWSTQRYLHNFPGVDVDDLVQEGRIALAKAAEKFDGRCKFISFAAFHVRGRMLRFCRMHSQTINAPLSKFQFFDFADWDAPAGDEGRPLSETMAADEPEDSLMGDRLASLLRRLHESEREVVRLYYWDCLTLQQIADRRGVSRQAVNQMLDKALAKMRRFGADLEKAA